MWSLTCHSNYGSHYERGPNAAALAENGHWVLHQSFSGSDFKQAQFTLLTSMCSSSSADCSQVMSRHCCYLGSSCSPGAEPAAQGHCLCLMPEEMSTAHKHQRGLGLLNLTQSPLATEHIWKGKHISAGLPWQQQSLCHSAAHPESALTSALTQLIIWAY